MRDRPCRLGTDGVPLLVTVDLEFACDHDREQQHLVLDTLRSELAGLGLSVTIFTTAAAADRFAPEVRRLAEAGHEIACHGLAHAPDEDYSRMPANRIRATLVEATRRIATVTGASPRCFRGPSMTCSAAAQHVLVELGYRADFSVCSQRLDIPNAAGSRLGWLVAPREPYRPSEASPYRRGSVPIQVVPLSCLGAPFLSGVLYLAGLRFMRGLFDVLLYEARRTAKPIVYAFHTYEFCDRWRAPRGNGASTRPKLLHRLYRQDRDWRYTANFALLRYMLSQTEIVPTTGTAYVNQLDGARVIARDPIVQVRSEQPLEVSPWCTRP